MHRPHDILIKTNVHAAAVVDSYFLDPLSHALTGAMLWIVRRWISTIFVVALATASAYFLYLIFVTHIIFWDFGIYVAAVEAMAAGKSPYDYAYTQEISGWPQQFVYPPLFAQTAYKLKWLLLTPAGATGLLVTHVVSWFSIPYLLAGSPKNWRSRDFLLLCAFYIILFGRGGLKLFCSGNIACILSALMIFSIVVAIRTRSYKLFWVAIIICSSIKIYFLAFLLIPIVMDKKYLSAIAVVIIVAGLYAIDYASNPRLFAEFLSAATWQSEDAFLVGRSLYSFVLSGFPVFVGHESHLTSMVAWGLHFIFAVMVLLFAYAVARGHGRPTRFDLFCCWIFMSAYLISPRLTDYDTAILIVPFVLLGQMLLRESRLGTGIAATVAFCGSVFLRTPLTDWSGLFAILGIWLGTGVHCLVAGQIDNSTEIKGEIAVDRPRSP